MVVINHSLGGDLTHLQVINTGDALMKGIFKDNAPRMMAELPADSLVKQALIFKANPRIKRVVFICAPHRGAPLASNQIGTFGARLIMLPGQILTGIGSATSAGRDLSRRSQGCLSAKQHPRSRTGLTASCCR